MVGTGRLQAASGEVFARLDHRDFFVEVDHVYVLDPREESLLNIDCECRLWLVRLSSRDLADTFTISPQPLACFHVRFNLFQNVGLYLSERAWEIVVF